VSTGVPVFGSDAVLDAEKIAEVKSTAEPLRVIVPSHKLIEATRSFSATTWVCTARPSGIAPRPIAKAWLNTSLPSGVQPVFCR
jgi:hypothetical protein